MRVYNLCLVTQCGGSVLLRADGMYVCSLCAREYVDAEVYGDYDCPRPEFGWTHMKCITALTLRKEGRSWAEIGAAIGKRPDAVRKYFQRNPPGDTREIKLKIADKAMAMVLSIVSEPG